MAGVSDFLQHEYDKSLFKIFIDYVLDKWQYLEEQFKISEVVHHTYDTIVVYLNKFGVYVMDDFWPKVKGVCFIVLNAFFDGCKIGYGSVIDAMTALYTKWLEVALPFLNEKIFTPIYSAWMSNVVPPYNTYAAEHVNTATIAVSKWYVSEGLYGLYFYN